MRISRTIPLLILALLLLLVLQTAPVLAESSAQNQVIIYFFWGDGCPHCAAAKPFLEELVNKHPGVELRSFEVWNVPENQQLLFDMADKFGFKPSGVPTIFIGDQYWVGYNDTIAAQIAATVSKCSNETCPDAGEGVVPATAGESAAPETLAPTKPPATEEQPAQEPAPQAKTSLQEHLLKVPLIGTIDLDKQSLVLSTLLISFVDGFNPCSLWVLSMLLALTLHTGSRRKIVIIGLVFLTVTALIYALFIAGLFSVLSFVSYLGWVQALIAVIALVFGAINIKDYFWYKEGVSFTISEKQKAGIYQKIRRIVTSSDSLVGMVSATVVLAAGVSLVEFSCTAGFPVLWTNILTAQGVDTLTFILLILLYMLIYQLDELVIFFSVVFTLRASKLEEKHGRILKLIGGVLMLTLAVVMLINPALMNDITNSLLIFGAAFLATLLILLVHRRILPAMGVWIGTEAKNKKRSQHRRHRK
ncbi:MAG: glutaredoxin family protein [Anaerolineae bacterium]|nr:glutaredoxin family protein [Anaerolineae bacterium]